MRRTSLALAATLLALLAVGGPGATANPVIRGDFPDPSVVRGDDAYYLAATSRSWAPLFPVFRSTDLVRWERIGAVLAQRPAWARGHFWAPELVRRPDGGFLAYYSASSRGGKACIGVASADHPAGPWIDQPPVLCRPGGAIDATAVRDRDGSLHLAFKAMGLGGGLYVQPLDPSGLAVVGPEHLMVVPDAEWERGVTEGPSLVDRDGMWTLLYSGGGCCRPPCDYAVGAARSPSLYGTWEKHPGNPLLRSNRAFRCPGHGTALDLDGAGQVLVHHAYLGGDTALARRQVVVSELDWGPEGWPVLSRGFGPVRTVPRSVGRTGATPARGWRDRFDGEGLAPEWEWRFNRVPALSVAEGELRMRCGRRTSLLARQVATSGFAATATVRPLTERRPMVGIAVHSSRENVLRGVEVQGRRARTFFEQGTRRRTNRWVTVGPPVPRRLGPPAQADERPAPVELRLVSGEGGELLARVRTGDAPPVVLPSGPAAQGSPPTRVVLTCRGTGREGGFTSASAMPRRS